MPGPNGGQVNCCGPAWASVFATRVAPDDGQLPPGRRRAHLLAHRPDPARPGAQPIADAVNPAVKQAAAARAARSG